MGGAPGSLPSRPPLVERAFTLLVAALSRMLEGRPAEGVLQLAKLACAVGTDEPGVAALQSVAELLDRRRRYAETTSLDGRRAAGFHLVLAAAAIAAAPRAPLPAGR